MDDPNLCIKESEISGYGIFTKIYRKSNDVIYESILKHSKVKMWPSKHSIQIGIDKHIEAGGLVSLINHSCDPNCIITPDFSLVAIKYIQACDELTYNYLTTEYDMDDKFSCLCQSPNCVRRIAGYKYSGTVPLWLVKV